MHGTGRGVIEISSRPEMNSSKVKSVLAPNSPIIAHLWGGVNDPERIRCGPPFFYQSYWAREEESACTKLERVPWRTRWSDTVWGR